LRSLSLKDTFICWSEIIQGLHGVDNINSQCQADTFVSAFIYG